MPRKNTTSEGTVTRATADDSVSVTVLESSEEEQPKEKKGCSCLLALKDPIASIFSVYKTQYGNDNLVLGILLQLEADVLRVVDK